MKCTSCHEGMLQPADLEPLLPCYTCTHCGGNWLYLEDYLRWLSRTSDADGPAPSVVDPEAVDTPRAMLCPRSGTLMLRYRISPDSPNKLDLSPAVNGVWLDRGEWELLKHEGLGRQLNAIFTDPWQRRIRETRARETFAALYEQEFGAEDYARLREFREWVRGCEKSAAMLAYLLAEDPYSAER